MGNIDTWRRAVESGKFIKYYGYPGEGHWEEDGSVSPKGFGISHLRTAPKGFPRDYPFLDYLKMKDYACWTVVSDDFFSGEQWKDEMARILQLMKPMIDFMNDVIDDYE